MKTKFTLITALVVAFFGLNAQQVPNGGFETWTNTTNPDGWVTVDALFQQPVGFAVKDVNDKVEGAASIKLKSDSLPGVAAAGVVPGLVSLGMGTYQSGVVSFMGVPFAFRPDTILFAYKYSSPGNDTAGLLIMLQKNGGDILSGGVPLDKTNQWAQVYVPLTANYLNSNVPDSLQIRFFSSFGNTAIKGSTLNVDDVRFGYVPTTAVNEVAQVKVNVYPNPASDVVTFNVADNAGKFHAEIVDVTGKVVAAADLANSVNTINISNLATGTYAYRLLNSSNAVVKEGKLNVAK